MQKLKISSSATRPFKMKPLNCLETSSFPHRCKTRHIQSFTTLWEDGLQRVGNVVKGKDS